LSSGDVAKALLCSTAQVNGLERGDASAFYGPVYFAEAMRKYAVFVGISSPLVAALLISGPPPRSRHSAPQVKLPAVSRIEPKGRGARPGWVIPLAAAVLLSSGVATAWYFRGSLHILEYAASAPSPVVPTPGPPPAEPVTTAPTSGTVAASLPPAPTVEQPERTAPPPHGEEGHLTLARAGWVYLRYADGTVVQRTLAAGGGLALTSLPVYLAVGHLAQGTGTGVSLTLNGRAVALGPFTTGNEIRIGASDLATLASAPR
jgi:hypothetical protein